MSRRPTNNGGVAAEAGLFVRTSEEAPFKKVPAEDFIRATEHRVHKAVGAIERYTLAVFYNAPMDIPIHSKSILTNDARYGAKIGEPCTYRHWHEPSFQRYVVKESK